MKYLILGAGPAGLAFANLLLDKGEDSFLILEKENEAGGLCRSKVIGGYPIDIGGGHFLDTRVTKAQQYILKFMPEQEWNRYSRSTKIDMYGEIIDNPIEAHIWQLPIEKQVEYIKSIAYAGANIGAKMPENFVDWIYWKLGDKIADEYMIPYNMKMFGKNLNELGTYWLYKLPTVNIDETLLSCLLRKMHGKYPAHTEFYYPKQYGFGEIWRRMEERVKGHIQYNINVKSLNCDTRMVNGQYQAECIINTIPWTEFEIIDKCSPEVQKYCRELSYTSLEVRYFEEDIDENYQWVYYPDLNLPYHRKFYRANFLEGSHGGYFETNIERIIPTNDWKYINKYAYPCNTKEKPKMIKTILYEMQEKNIIGVGRWGEWEHLNADAVVQHAMEIIDNVRVENRGI